MSHILDIIIKATDQATQTTNKVKESIKNMGDSTTAAGGKFEGLKNKVTSVTGRIKEKWNNMSSEMKTAIGAGLTAAGMALTNFLKDSIKAASESEKGWIAYKNSLQTVSGQTVTDTAAMKKAVVDMANQTGRSTADVRTAMTNLMNKGLDFATAQKAAYAASGMAAAGLASDEASASNMIIQALNGRGMALKKLGINIDDYKDKVTGQIDTQRLLADITKKTGGAQSEYANSAEAAANRLNNAWGKIKTDVGTQLMPVLQQLAGVLMQVLSWFNSLPEPVRNVAIWAGILAGAVLMLAGPITSLIGLLGMLGIELNLVTIAEKAKAAADAIVTAAQWALNAAGYANPYVLLAMAILALIAALVYLYYHNENVRKAVDKLSATLKGALKKAFEIIQSVIGKTVGFFKQLYNAFKLAITYAKGMVSTIVNKVKELPGKIYNEFAKIPGKIKQSMSNAVSAAGEWGSQVVSHLKDIMGIHSPGFIQKAVVGEFSDTIDRIDGLTGKAAKAGGAFGSALMGGFSLDTDLSRNSNLKVNQKVTVEHDFSNLPNGVSAEEVARIVNKTAGSETFARTLASNQVFQSADSTMKDRLNRRSSRLGGA